MNWKNLLIEVQHYPAGVVEEIRKVDWPSRQETKRLSLAVGVVIAIATLYVAGIDVVFSRLIELILSQ
jgi:preprotein translocase SecE subunit